MSRLGEICLLYPARRQNSRGSVFLRSFPVSLSVIFIVSLPFFLFSVQLILVEGNRNDVSARKNKKSLVDSPKTQSNKTKEDSFHHGDDDLGGAVGTEDGGEQEEGGISREKKKKRRGKGGEQEEEQEEEENVALSYWKQQAERLQQQSDHYLEQLQQMQQQLLQKDLTMQVEDTASLSAPIAHP